MVGHLLCYHPGVRQLADLIAKGELGEVYYLYSQRLNLGKLRADENALWSLGAHDVSVLLELADGPAQRGHGPRRGLRARRASRTSSSPTSASTPGLAAHLHLSWLDPHKERRLTVVGSERMATLDDMALERKLTIYDKGFDPAADNYGEYITRSGAVVSPAVPNDEPLRLECRHFIDCLAEGSRPRTDGHRRPPGRARARGAAGLARLGRRARSRSAPPSALAERARPSSAPACSRRRGRRRRHRRRHPRRHRDRRRRHAPGRRGDRQAAQAGQPLDRLGRGRRRPPSSPTAPPSARAPSSSPEPAIGAQAP